VKQVGKNPQIPNHGAKHRRNQPLAQVIDPTARALSELA
jgi:hypothetical protein